MAWVRVIRCAATALLLSAARTAAAAERATDQVAPSPAADTATAAPSTESAEIGLEAQTGRIFLTSDTSTEANKSGPTSAGMLFVRDAAWHGAYQLGLGLETSQLSGANPAAGIANQDLHVSAPYAEGRYLFSLPNNFEFGLSVRGYYGKGANFDVQHTDRASYALAPGALFAYRVSVDSWSVTATAGYHAFTALSTVRAVSFGFLGLSVAYHLGASEGAS